MTSAPRSDRIMPPRGPAWYRANSRTRTPSRLPTISVLPRPAATSAPILPLSFALGECVEQVFPRRVLADEGEGAALGHLAGRGHEGVEREPRTAAADADALDPDRGEVGRGDRRVGMGHHDVDRLGDRRYHRADRIEVLEARRVEHAGARLLECLQPPDCAVDVITAVDQLLSP